MCVYICISLYIHIYIYIYIDVSNIYIYIYIYIYVPCSAAPRSGRHDFGNGALAARAGKRGSDQLIENTKYKHHLYKSRISHRNNTTFAYEPLKSDLSSDPPSRVPPPGGRRGRPS